MTQTTSNGISRDAALTLANFLSSVVVEDLRWSCPLTMTQSAAAVYDSSPGLTVRGPLTTLSIIVPSLLQLRLTLPELRRKDANEMRQLAHSLGLDAAQYAALMSIRSDEQNTHTEASCGVACTSRSGQSIAIVPSGEDVTQSMTVLCKKCHPKTFPAVVANAKADGLTYTTRPATREHRNAAPSVATTSDSPMVDDGLPAVTPTHFAIPTGFAWSHSPTVTSFFHEFLNGKGTVDWASLSSLLTVTEATVSQRGKAAEWWQAVTTPSSGSRRNQLSSLTVPQLCQMLDKGSHEAAQSAFRKYTRSSPWYAVLAELNGNINSLTPQQDSGFRRCFVNRHVLTLDDFVQSWLLDPTLMISFFPFFVCAAPAERVSQAGNTKTRSRSTSRRRGEGKRMAL